MPTILVVLTSFMLLGLEEVIDLTVSKSGTWGSLEPRTVFLIVIGQRLPHHNLCKKPKSRAGGVGPASAFRTMHKKYKHKMD